MYRTETPATTECIQFLGIFLKSDTVDTNNMERVALLTLKRHRLNGLIDVESLNCLSYII